MVQASGVRACSPRQISFAGAQQTLDAFRVALQIGTGESWREKVEALLWAIGGHRVGKRPDRCEPREVKRRPKLFPLMTRSRATRREELLANHRARLSRTQPTWVPASEIRGEELFFHF